MLAWKGINFFRHLFSGRKFESDKASRTKEERPLLRKQKKKAIRGLGRTERGRKEKQKKKKD